MPEQDAFLSVRAHREAAVYIYDNLIKFGDSDKTQTLLLNNLEASGTLAGVPERKRGIVGALALDRALESYETLQQICSVEYYKSTDWES